MEDRHDAERAALGPGAHPAELVVGNLECSPRGGAPREQDVLCEYVVAKEGAARLHRGRPRAGLPQNGGGHGRQTQHEPPIAGAQASPA